MPKQDSQNTTNTQDFSDEKQPLRDRLNAEWLSSVALREVLGIAKKETPTYGETLSIASILAPKLFSEDSLLIAANESILTKQYRQKAVALSKKLGKEVTPLEAINEDINEYSELLKQPSRDQDLLQRHYQNLVRARTRLTKEKYTETQSILRDISSYRTQLPVTNEGKGYKDFQVTKERGLRIRMLHPDSWEHVLGADVIYETHWQAKKMVRIVAIQYKMWDGKKLYLSQVKNLPDQITKLQSQFCKRGYCKKSSKSKRKDPYRLPFCSAFLRLTDKLQVADYRLLTSSYHTPICALNKSWTVTPDDNKILESQMIRSESLTQKPFEELFNIGMLGSRWLTYQELETLYKDTDIFKYDQSVQIHAQEFGFVDETFPSKY
jgi:hypothetical protein